MKLSWKIVLTVLVIVTLTVSVSGYTMVAASFQSELEAVVSSSVDESQMLCLTLGALAARSAGGDTAILDLLRGSAFFGNYDMIVFRADGSRLWDTRDGEAAITPGDMGEPDLSYRFVRRSGGRSLETLQRVSIGSQAYYVNITRGADQPFLQRDRNLGIYRQVMLCSLALSILGAMVSARVLTGPIRKLSRSTRAVAGGQYSRRVRVKSRDELGALAEDFNHMADALEAKLRELEEAAQRQRDFTASFAHELKTPLTSVIGYADTLRSRELPRQQQLEAVGYIFSEGKRLEAMSFSLLDLFALERSEPQLGPVNARRLAREAAESASYPFAQGEIPLEVEAAPGTVLGEGNLLKTLLYNLLDNARKASQPGSTVELWGGPGEGGYVFRVTDHGRGIPPESLSRITEPFYMVDKSRARAQGGAGLGLALCQRIAQAHGTQLRYESRVGEGTVVEFRLQLAPEPDPGTPANAAP